MMTTETEPKIEFKYGEAIKSRWGQWYRHDKVIVDGKELEGYIQVRRRYYGKRMGHRIESITCHSQSCVMGSDVWWLAKENGVEVPKRWQGSGRIN